MKIEVLQKDKLWWLVINGVEVASSKLQCDALLVAKQLREATGGPDEQPGEWTDPVPVL